MLYCKKSDEKQLWLTAFNYVVLSTQKVQEIEKRNKLALDQQFQQQTRQMNKRRNQRSADTAATRSAEVEQVIA